MRPGAEDRRLAAARGADDTGERSAREPGNEVGDDLLPSIEVIRVADVEERKTLERAQHDTAVPVRGHARAELKRRVVHQDCAFE